jgi:hypothetical protein
MYPPASGAGADRRQDLQPEVFILQLVDSSAWGMNEPPAGLNPQGANMGKRRRPGVTRGDPGFTSCLAGTPARESRRRVPPSALGGWDRDEVPKDPVHFLAPRPDAGGHNPRPDGTIFPMATRSTVCKFRLTLEERRALDADAGLSLPRGVLPDLRCSADPASARLGNHRLLHLRGGQLGATQYSWRF